MAGLFAPGLAAIEFADVEIGIMLDQHGQQLLWKVSMEDIRGFLQSIPFFSAALDPAHLDALAASAHVRQFAAGSTILQERDSGDSMFVIFSGTVSIHIEHDGGNLKVATLGGGQIFGEMSLMMGVPRLATVAADTDVEAIEIDKPAMKPIVMSSPALFARIADVLQKRQMELDQIYDPAFWRRYGRRRENMQDVMRRYFGGP